MRHRRKTKHFLLLVVFCLWKWKLGYLWSDLDFCEPRTLAHHLGEYLRMMGALVCGLDPVKFASSNELGNGKQLTTAVLPESRLAAAGIACMQLGRGMGETSKPVATQTLVNPHPTL